MKKIKISKAFICTLIFGGLLILLCMFVIPFIGSFQGQAISNAYTSFVNQTKIDYLSIFPTIFVLLLVVICIIGLCVSLLIIIVKQMKLTCYDPIRNDISSIKKIYDMHAVSKKENKENKDK